MQHRFSQLTGILLASLLLGLSVGMLIAFADPSLPPTSTAFGGAPSPRSRMRERKTPPVLISALHYDGYAPDDDDEAFQLTVVGPAAVDLRGWTVSDGEATAVFPVAVLQPGTRIWVARTARAFWEQFGFRPDWELVDTDPFIPQLGGGVPRFRNAGDELILRDATGAVVDVVVYNDGELATVGWYGGAVRPYAPSPTFAASGQILYRKLDEATGLPLGDTDTLIDWMQDPTDPWRGQRAVYPGWDLERFWQPTRITETATLTVAVAPDHLYEFVTAQIASAQASIRFHGYTLENPAIAQALAARARAGVQVTLLLEGGPVGGMRWEGKWAAAQIEEAGGQVYFMVNDPDAGIYDRYRAYHLKVFLIDERLVLIGSENPGPGAMPFDEKENGTLGHRGVYLATDAPGVVTALRRILDADLAPAEHRDIVRWRADDPRFAPPDWFTPRGLPDYTMYPVRWPAPRTFRGTFAFEVISAPENSLRTTDGLLGLVARVGAGDTLYVQQLQEPPHWGGSNAALETNPNVRLEAFIAAARRGARVRLLLDRYFDDPGAPVSNAATVAYVNRLAAREGLDLEARLGNPTGLGIHNKMVLARIDGRGYVHVGSLNGSEASSKLNREIALQVQADEAYEFLARVFELDWALSTPDVFLPLVLQP